MINDSTFSQFPPYYFPPQRRTSVGQDSQESHSARRRLQRVNVLHGRRHRTPCLRYQIRQDRHQYMLRKTSPPGTDDITRRYGWHHPQVRMISSWEVRTTAPAGMDDITSRTPIVRTISAAIKDDSRITDKQQKLQVRTTSHSGTDSITRK